MSEHVNNSPWTDSTFLEDAHTWIRERLSSKSMQLVGEITQPHVRPWATAIRIPTDMGTVWFKATTATLGHESAITRALATWLPFRTPFVYSSDIYRNWLLMADGGVTLRSLLKPDNAERLLWELALTYARLQQAAADRVELMLTIGTPDLRAEGISAAYSALLDDTAALRIGEKDGLTPDEYSTLRRLSPRVREIAAELADFGIPATLQHNDLHSNNVLVRDGKLILFDWGDSVVSHPFLSLTVLLRGAARNMKVEVDDPAVRRIRDAYLDAWDLGLSPVERDRACLLADALGRITRAVSWNRLLPGLDAAARAEYAPMVAAWLQEFLSAPAVESLEDLKAFATNRSTII